MSHRSCTRLYPTVVESRSSSTLSPDDCRKARLYPANKAPLGPAALLCPAILYGFLLALSVEKCALMGTLVPRFGCLKSIRWCRSNGSRLSLLSMYASSHVVVGGCLIAQVISRSDILSCAQCRSVQKSTETKEIQQLHEPRVLCCRRLVDDHG